MGLLFISFKPNVLPILNKEYKSNKLIKLEKNIGMKISFQFFEVTH